MYFLEEEAIVKKTTNLNTNRCTEWSKRRDSWSKIEQHETGPDIDKIRSKYDKGS